MDRLRTDLDRTTSELVAARGKVQGLEESIRLLENEKDSENRENSAKEEDQRKQEQARREKFAEKVKKLQEVICELRD